MSNQSGFTSLSEIAEKIMTISARKLYGLLRNCDKSSSMGKRAEKALNFCDRHKNESTEYFVKATEKENLDATGLGSCLRTFSRLIHADIAFQSDYDQEFCTESGKIFLEQLEKWNIPLSVASPRSIPRRIGSINNDAYIDIPWIDIQNPSEAQKGAEPISRSEYSAEALKSINCLCEFYFGERFMPCIEPAEQHEPLTLSDVQEAWLVNQSSLPKELDVTHMEAQMQKMLLEDRYWKCDLPR